MLKNTNPPHLHKNRKNDKKLSALKYNGSLAFAAVAMLTLLAGCTVNAPLSLLDKVQAGAQRIKSSSYQAAAASIDNYCNRIPEDKRFLVRSNINSRTSVGDIYINCESNQ